MPASRGGKLLQALWAKDKYRSGPGMRSKAWSVSLSSPRSPNRDVIRQDEYGNFMIVLLTGTIAVDRAALGRRIAPGRNAARRYPGRMSLLDSGIHFRHAPR